MLNDLQIKNFAIIDDLHISFLPGLTILSGETGAGKSIIIGALNLILGGRATGDLIRTGENEAIVESLFDISGDEAFSERLVAKGISTGGNNLLIKRIISQGGKNKVIINGNLATLGILTEITESLLNISGQHEHQELLRPQNHIDILDNHGGLMSIRGQYKRSFQIMQQLGQELEDLKAEKNRETEQQELFSFQWREIQEARLVVGEEEELRKEKRILQNAGDLIRTTQQIYESIYGGDRAILTQLNREVRDLKEITGIDPDIIPYFETLESILVQLEDVAISLRDYRQKIHFDPQGLEEIEGRLDTIHRLKKKYGASIEEILEFQKKIKAEMEQISQRKDHRVGLEEKYNLVKREASIQAKELSRKRKETAKNLGRKIENELESLGMPSTKFVAHINQPGSGILDEKGMDQVEFLFSPNPGEELRPLARIASGGELSRVMLAFKNIFAQVEGISTLIFDEVDSGIGGATAEVVGQKLYEISRYYQTICITHLPQIACYGDRHYSISKRIEEGRAKTRVKRLDPEDRVDEIARMLGGAEITSKTRTLAREMVEVSKRVRSRQ
ncbi:MAG: DNA repair protein RecN [Deltaproteobacteria bacterium]|nr:DNA repair protein RecN [Deltaproteobacteria bacterium]